MNSIFFFNNPNYPTKIGIRENWSWNLKRNIL